MPYLDEFILLSFAALMIWAAVTDFRSYVIPNRVCVALLGLYPAYVLSVWQTTNPGIWIVAVVLAFAVFACGLGLFAAGALGGGDVKLITIGALWAGPSLILPFFFITAFTGLILSAFVTFKTSFQMAQAQTSGSMSRSVVVAGFSGLRHVPVLKLMIPYGTAIATGGLYVAYRHLTG